MSIFLRNQLNLLTIFTLLLLFSSFASADLTTDGKAYYTFDENTGTTANDEIGTANLTITTGGGSWTTGIINSGYQLSSTSFMTAPVSTIAGGTGDISVSFWANWKGTALAPGENYWLWFIGAGSNSQRLGVLRGAGANTIKITTGTGSATSITTDIGITNTNAWRHYVVVLKSSGTSVEVFENGYSIANRTITARSSPTPTRIDINGAAGGSTYPFGDNQIDEFYVVERALSSSEVLELYNAGAGLQYPFSTTPTAGTITAYDLTNSDALNNFTLTFPNATQLSTTNGTITYDWNLNITHNFTISATGFYNESYTDINMSSAFQANLTQYTSIGARDYYTNATLALNNSNTVTSNGVLYNAGAENTDSNKVYLYTEESSTTVNASFTNYYLNSTTQDLSKGQSALVLTLVPYPYLRINATSLLNGTAITTFNSTITNSTGSVIGTYGTTNGTIIVQLPIDTYNVTFDSEDYEYDEALVAVSGQYTDKVFSVYTTNSVEITYRDAVTNALVTGNISVEFVSSLFSYNYSTSNSTIYIDLLSPTDYTLRSTATGYDQNTYFFTLTNRTYNNFTIYMTNSSDTTEVTIKVVNSVDNQPLTDYVVKVIKYNPGTNTYVTNEILTTNFEGEAVADIYLGTEFYRFIIENTEGVVVETTDPSYIYKTSLTISVNIGAEVLEDYTSYQGLSGSLVYNTDTDSFRYTYSDSSNTLTEICMKVQYTQGYSTTQLTESCATSASGVIVYPINETNGTTFIASIYATFGNGETFITSLSKSFVADQIDDSNWLFYTALLTMAVILLLLWNPMIMIMAMPVPTLLFSLLGFIPIGRDVAIGITLVFLLVGGYVGSKLR